MSIYDNWRERRKADLFGEMGAMGRLEMFAPEIVPMLNDLVVETSSNTSLLIYLKSLPSSPRVEIYASLTNIHDIETAILITMLDMPMLIKIIENNVSANNEMFQNFILSDSMEAHRLIGEIIYSKMLDVLVVNLKKVKVKRLAMRAVNYFMLGMPEALMSKFGKVDILPESSRYDKMYYVTL